MAISKKRIPRETDLPRALSYIYNDINEIINSINTQEHKFDSTKGKPGDLQVVKEPKKQWSSKHKLTFKTDDGWEELITSPSSTLAMAKSGTAEVPKNIVLGYNVKEEAWDIANVTDVLDFQWGSPASVSLKPSSYTTNEVNSSTGVQIATPISATSIVIGATDGAKYTLQNRTLSGDDISYTTDSSTATFTVKGASSADGLLIPDIDESGMDTTTNKLYSVGSTLKWNGTNIGDGGGGDNAFKHIEISGQDTVSAEIDADTLTLVNGSNITMTTDAGNDTITLNSVDTKATITDVNNTTDYSNTTALNIQNAAISSTSTGIVDINTRVNMGTDAITNPWTANNAVLMPNIGDVYVRDNGTHAELHVRTGTEYSRKVKYWSESSAPTPDPTPQCDFIGFSLLSNGSVEYNPGELPIGTTATVYGIADYDADVTAPIDSGTPEAHFKTYPRVGSPSGTTELELGGSFDKVTTSTITVGASGDTDTDLRDGYTKVTPSMTGCTEGGYAVTVTNSANQGKRIYWRNYRLSGSCVGEPTASDLSSATNKLLSTTSIYSVWDSIEITHPQSGRVFFAFPSDTTDIDGIFIDGNPSDQKSTFTTKIISWTNEHGAIEDYKVWYHAGPQASATLSWTTEI